MSNKYEHIFFDLDRTLWHFDENSKKVLNDIYINFELNNTIQSASIFIDKYQEINEILWRAYSKNKISKEDLRWKRFADTLLHYNIEDDDLSIKIGDYYVNHSPRQTLLFPYTKEVLEYLYPKYKLHIITNGFEEVQFIKLKESGILDYFQEVILSEKVGVKKPHPYIFKKAFSLSGATSNNSIMIGDDLYADIYGAQRVGMDHVYFNFYDKVHDKIVQHEITSLDELYNIL